MSKSSFKPGADSVLLGLLAVVVVFAASRLGREMLGLELSGFTKIIYIFVIAVIAVSLGAISLRLARVHQKETQAKRDETACSESEAFSLYLRPFYTGGKLPVPNSARSEYVLSISRYTQNEIIDLEVQLARAAERIFPMRAIGGWTVGAGKVEVNDAEWKSAFQRLAEKARVIFLVPLDQPGTRWEISWLKAKRLFAKVICVMPPSTVIEGKPMKETWEEARSALRNDGLQLPPYHYRGSLFLLNDDGTVRLEAAHGFVDEAVQDLMQRLLSLAVVTRRPVMISALVAVSCGILWGIANYLLKDIVDLFSLRSIGLLVAAGATGLAVRSVWPEFSFKFLLRILIGLFSAFFASVAVLALGQEYLTYLTYLPRTLESLFITVTASFWGGYSLAAAVRRGNAVMTDSQKHFIAWAWILPVSLIAGLLVLLRKESLLPAAWGVGTTVGVFVMLRIVSNSHTEAPVKYSPKRRFFRFGD